ncbi:MAG TPA: glycosyltransferase family 39 protein, partial [Candidatus Acidoferrum sp.]|nr:glycosyltransferase family 39 protein [Candidatus Acidoferrum sp.]
MAVERSDYAKPRVSGFDRFRPRALFLLLLVSLPLLNPWVRGDGVGYYAFARALLIQHNLDFTADYQHANEGFRESRLDAQGRPKDAFRTATGHLENHFTVGPAILWAPLLVVAHAGVLTARAFGSTVAADGFSLPYLLAMATGTLLAGFLALVLSYRVACRFVPERSALLGTIAVWWASSLPVYMYFNPSWSHAHSAFAVALFFWYWLRTGESRSAGQWVLLGLIAGLALNVYYPNVLALAVLVPEAFRSYRPKPASPGEARFPTLLSRHLLFCATTLFCLLPTFVTKYFIYGGPFETGYTPIAHWGWRSPWLLALLFSANHGLFSWTPVLLLA